MSEATRSALLDSESCIERHAEFESSRKTKVSVAYRITKDQEEVWRTVETEDHLHQGGEQLTIERFIPVSSLAPGPYTIEVSAIDLLTNETVIRSSDFTVKPAAVKPNASVPIL